MPAATLQSGTKEHIKDLETDIRAVLIPSLRGQRYEDNVPCKLGRA
jgi:hypothetical protein